jgi:tungstate transport system substrate-binding protein
MKKGKRKNTESTSLSRREFLKDAGLVLGGVALGSLPFLDACSATPTTIVETQTLPTTVVETATATATSTSTSTKIVTTTAPPITATATTTTTSTATTIITTTAPATSTTPKPANPNLILATTTSTRDTGLLDVLVPMFQTQTGYVVKTVAVGSGAAIALGQSGNADVLLVHSPAAEKTFMATGAGINRILVMNNDFVLVGPASDPAQVKGTALAVDAMKKIYQFNFYQFNCNFVSRGDNSGTNAFELSVWKLLGFNPVGNLWYLSTGQGMGATLIVADQKNGYTISDRGTYMAFKSSISLTIDVDGTNTDSSMINVYHVIQVNQASFPNVTINTAGAKAFSDFLVSPATQSVIGSFGLVTYGTALFTPDAGKPDIW